MKKLFLLSFFAFLALVAPSVWADGMMTGAIDIDQTGRDTYTLSIHTGDTYDHLALDWHYRTRKRTIPLTYDSDTDLAMTLSPARRDFHHGVNTYALRGTTADGTVRTWDFSLRSDDPLAPRRLEVESYDLRSIPTDCTDRSTLVGAACATDSGALDHITTLANILKNGPTRTIVRFLDKNLVAPGVRIPFFGPVYASHRPLAVRSVGGSAVMLATEGRDDRIYAIERLSVQGDIVSLEKRYIDIPAYLDRHQIDPDTVTSDDLEKALLKDFKKVSRF